VLLVFASKCEALRVSDLDFDVRAVDTVGLVNITGERTL